MSDHALPDAVRIARTTGDWHPLIAALPYVGFLGSHFTIIDGRLIGRMPFADHLVGNPMLPALHGGTLAGLLESAAHLELLFDESTTVLPKTITSTVDYLRSGRPLDTLVLAKVFKRGRRVCTVHATAWQDDETKPIATATIQLLILGAQTPVEAAAGTNESES